MRPVVLIGNPVAGGGALRKIKRAAELLKGMGYPVRLLLTRQRGDAEEFARETAAGSPRSLVIAAGGDGTYNEVANGLAHTPVTMAILPLGTASVLAREFGIPLRMEEALSLALGGTARKIHLGRITFPGDRTPQVRYFLLMAGIGFDGEAVYRVSGGLKKIAGKAAYLLSGLRVLGGYNPSPLFIRAETENEQVSMTAYMIVISKASCYGGNFRISPDATLFAPYLSVFACQGRRRQDFLRYLWGILKGRHLDFDDISSFQSTEIEVQGRAHVQVDGDYAGMTPVQVGVAFEALNLVVSRD
ncbi:MAG: diacylglycerol kinase family protein [Thermodesulfovibrionales bacterium]|jgi:YegS/Rv2252/BmrU family lipid kinase